MSINDGNRKRATIILGAGASTPWLKNAKGDVLSTETITDHLFGDFNQLEKYYKSYPGVDHKLLLSITVYIVGAVIK